MPYKLIDNTTEEPEMQEQRIYGVAIASVHSNKDLLGLGRVEVTFPWAPGITAWARVVTPMAGMNRGFYFMPQDGDEVLVAFQNGDISAPYIIGALWNTLDRPPITPGDIVAPSTKRIIRTGSLAAHEVVFDDVTQSITITSITQQEISIDPAQIKLSTAGGLSSIMLVTAGNIAIKGALSIDLQAASIKINGTNVNITSSAATSINGGPTCNIQAALVKIN